MPKPLWPRGSAAVGLALLLAFPVLLGLRIDEFVFSRSHAVVRLEGPEARMIEGCRTITETLRLQGRPAMDRMSGCDLIDTDHGSFGLVSSWSLLPFTMGRGEMVGLLVPGSCREIRWFGSDRDPEGPSWAQSLSTNNTIYHVASRDDDDCPPLPPPDPEFWRADPEGVRLQLFVELTPEAPFSEIVGIIGSPGGASFLHLRIAASPQDEPGDEVVLRLLGERLDLPRPAIRTVPSDYNVGRTVLLRGDPDDLTRRLKAFAW